nr:myosin-9-like [Coffea arabica]
MAGSRKGKHKKKKEKSNPHKSKENNKQIDISVIKSELGHEKEGDKCDAKHTEDKQVEKLLYLKIEIAYEEACLIMSKMGYDTQTIEGALLRAGYIFGEPDIRSSIMKSTLTLINSSRQENGKVIFNEEQEPIFKTLAELIEFWVQDLVNLVERQRPGLSKSSAMQQILSSKLLAIEKTNQSLAPDRVEASSSSEVSGANQFDFDAFLKENALALKRLTGLTYTPELASQSEKNATSSASPQEQGQISLEDFEFDQISNPFEGFQGLCDETRLRNCSEEQKHEIIFSLEELIRSLEQQVEDRKNWALNKRRESRASLVSHSHELIMLSLEKEKREQLAKEKEELATSMSKMILKKENAQRTTMDQIDRLYQQLGKVQAENLRLRAELTSIELNESESKKNMKLAMKKEKEDLKKIENSEKHISKTNSLINQEKEKILQLEVELKNVVQAQEEAKLKFKQEIEEKEQARILVSEEKKLTRIAREYRDRKLSALEQKLEVERRRVMDDKERLMLEASILKTQHLLGSSVSEAESSQNLAQAMLIPDHRRCYWLLVLLANLKRRSYCMSKDMDLLGGEKYL